MIASLLLALAATAAATALSAAYQQHEAAEEEALALQIAEALANEVAAVPYEPEEPITSDPPPSSDSSGGLISWLLGTAGEIVQEVETINPLNELTDTVVDPEGNTYHRTLIITAEPTLGSAALATVTVITPGGRTVIVTRLLVPDVG